MDGTLNIRCLQHRKIRLIRISTTNIESLQDSIHDILKFSCSIYHSTQQGCEYRFFNSGGNVSIPKGLHLGSKIFGNKQRP